MVNKNEPRWFKSSYSGDQGSCVEVADTQAATGVVMVRDSKIPSGPALSFDPATFAGFISDLRDVKYSA